MATDSVGTNRRNGATTCTMALTGSMQVQQTRLAGSLAGTPPAQPGLVQFTKGLMKPILAQLTDCTDIGAGCQPVLAGSLHGGWLCLNITGISTCVCLSTAGGNDHYR